MAVFAGLSEAVSAAALPFITGEAQDRLIWFVTLFPSALVALFFVTLWASPRRLYGPGDFKSDEGYLAAQMTLVSQVKIQGDAARKLRLFWKTDGNINEANAKALQKWMQDNGIGTDLITVFITAQEYAEDRDRAVAHFAL
jgi:hypothetical protein